MGMIFDWRRSKISQIVEGRDKRRVSPWEGKFTGIASVSVRLSGTLGDLEVALVRHLVHGVLAAGEEFAGIAVAVAKRVNFCWFYIIGYGPGGQVKRRTRECELLRRASSPIRSARNGTCRSRWSSWLSC